jgi:hypothetical protein
MNLRVGRNTKRTKRKGENKMVTRKLVRRIGLLFATVATTLTLTGSVVLALPVVPPSPDTTKPTITITTPANNATYRLGEPAKAAYTCADTGGSGLYSCQGTVPNGSYINTGTVGTKSFTVTARDRAGNTTSVTRTYTVEPLPDYLPDLSVSVAPAGELSSSPTNCRRVTFYVKREWPSNGSYVTHQSAEYKVFSQIFDGTRNLGGGQVAQGLTPDFGIGTSTKTVTVGFTWPSNVVYPAGDFTNKITVVVDPNNLVSETREWNNSSDVYANCIG